MYDIDRKQHPHRNSGRGYCKNCESTYRKYRVPCYIFPFSQPFDSSTQVTHTISEKAVRNGDVEFHSLRLSPGLCSIHPGDDQHQHVSCEQASPGKEYHFKESARVEDEFEE